MTADTYITMQNDAWDAIAYRLWGEERLFVALLKANPEHLDTVLFPAGVELRVPLKPESAIKLELPPWM
ncbi:MAG: tail protein X [Desulfobulbaceae bacterium]|jgi:phage tail protein X|nr:tail protein X [Desulfobulbaceae bacterium]